MDEQLLLEAKKEALYTSFLIDTNVLSFINFPQYILKKKQNKLN